MRVGDFVRDTWRDAADVVARMVKRYKAGKDDKNK